jgi:4-hydroxy-tetrahydrodipicolinate synthase
MIRGTYTALITPMLNDGEIDWDGLRGLVEFQIAGGVDGLVAAGTTGESPTLDDKEYRRLLECVVRTAAGRVPVLAGAGSNSTRKALALAQTAATAGVDGLLLVDPYYNGPGSLEIRREYLQPIARAFPHLWIVPYVVPARTGTALEPHDLALLRRDCPNVVAVKEASGDRENTARIRTACGVDFGVLSGDDADTLDLILDGRIAAQGVVSVVANLVPAAVASYVRRALAGDREGACRSESGLRPLLECVQIRTEQGGIVRRSRNPVPIKSMMGLLGLPSGPCRQPLGRLTPAGLQAAIAALQAARQAVPDLFDAGADSWGAVGEIGIDVSVAPYLEGELA